ncbi:MAG: CCA tRNA nucleotidyltransferase [Hydrogenothermaceae bacterium]|nr:CCA tRNA nucleotidyltransferase [Hydrogenothermaceae bacterium]
MLSFDGFLQRIFSKKKEENIEPSEFNYNYIHGLLFYNTYFDALAKALPKDSFCFIVGGWVRDRILNRPIGKKIDIDFLITAPPIEVAKNLKSIVGGNIFQFEKEKTVATILFEEGDYRYRFDFSYLDISGIPEGLDFEEKDKFIYHKVVEDLINRDFTINAIAVNFDDTYSLSASQTVLIDPTGGFKDLQEGVVRPVSIKNIEKDPVRIIRGYRIASELNFSVDREFDRFARKNLFLLSSSPKERVRDELIKVINSEQSYQGLIYLRDSGLFDFITNNNLDDIDNIRKIEEILKKNPVK